MLIWSATESTSTIMCSSIPVLRPLYTRLRYGKDGKGSSGAGSSGNTSYKLPLYARHNPKYGGYSKSGFKESEIETGLETTNDSGPGTGTDTMCQRTGTRRGSSSHEDILRGAADIERTDEVSVTYETMRR